MNKTQFVQSVFVFALALIGSIQTATAQETPHAQLERKLQAKLDEIVSSNGMPGATFAIVLGDRTTIEISSGFEDPETQKKMAVGSRMFCGSTGKTFVSAVALQLVSEGKLKLNDLASKYLQDDKDLAWFAQLPNSKRITIRSLLNHTSGLPRHIFQDSFLKEFKANPMRSRTPQECLSALHGVAATSSVGEGWSYSDSNYLVIGLIIEKVTGQSYYELAQQRLLDPLNLKSTIAASQPKLEGLIQGHIGSDNFFAMPKKTLQDGAYAVNPNFEWCGGGFVTNTTDLAIWLHGLHTGRVLDDETYRQLIEPVGFRDGQPAEQGYGLGTFVWITPSGVFYGHAGIMPGYLTQIEFSPKHNIAGAFQTNSDEGMGRGLHQHVQTLIQIAVDHQTN